MQKEIKAVVESRKFDFSLFKAFMDWSLKYELGDGVPEEEEEEAPPEEGSCKAEVMAADDSVVMRDESLLQEDG